MQTSVASGYRWKSKDLERLPDEPFLTYEIIDGELVVSRQPHVRHGVIIARLCSRVSSAVEGLGELVIVEPGIVWSDEAENNVVPDSPSSFPIASILPRVAHCRGPRTS